MRSAWYVHTTSCIFILFYAIYIICFIHSHTCCVSYCASSPSRFDSIFDTISCFFVPLELMPLLSFFQLNARDTFLLLDSGNTPGNKILWIYGFFGIKFVPKMEMRFTFRPTEMVPEKKINSAMNGPQNAWKSGRLTSFLLSGCLQHSCKTTIFTHPQDMREIYRDKCKLHDVTTRHSENEISCILFFPAVRSNNFVIHFYFGTNDGIRLAKKCLLRPCVYFCTGKLTADQRGMEAFAAAALLTMRGNHEFTSRSFIKFSPVFYT
jgi:hypothetical protein